MTEAASEGAASLLLSVQQDCIAAEARATAAEAKLADLASAVMEEVEPALGERMRCVRLARAVKEATP